MRTIGALVIWVLIKKSYLFCKKTIYIINLWISNEYNILKCFINYLSIKYLSFFILELLIKKIFFLKIKVICLKKRVLVFRFK